MLWISRFDLVLPELWRLRLTSLAQRRTQPHCCRELLLRLSHPSGSDPKLCLGYVTFSTTRDASAYARRVSARLRADASGLTRRPCHNPYPSGTADASSSIWRRRDRPPTHTGTLSSHRAFGCRAAASLGRFVGISTSYLGLWFLSSARLSRPTMLTHLLVVSFVILGALQLPGEEPREHSLEHLTLATAPTRTEFWAPSTAAQEPDRGQTALVQSSQQRA